MKHHLCAAALLALGAFAGGTAQAAADKPAMDKSACLEPINYYSWKVINDRAVVVTDKLRHDYKLSLEPGCFGLDFSMRLGFRTFSPSRLACVERGDWVIVPRDGGIPGQRCMIQKIEAYTHEMAQADAAAKAAAH
jgi:hypothetical protein